MVNLGDIAKATGYSKATVSRVLSGDLSFAAKESTRHRIIQVANELGYALRTSRAGIPMTVAVLENFDASHGPRDAYFSDVREALRERAAESMRCCLTVSSSISTLRPRSFTPCDPTCNRLSLTRSTRYASRAASASPLSAATDT